MIRSMSPTVRQSDRRHQSPDVSPAPFAEQADQTDELTTIRIVPQGNRSHPADAGAATGSGAAKPSARRLSRTLLNFWLDAALGILFSLLSITAVIVQFVFPPAIAVRGTSLWGLSYGQWCSLQFGLIAMLGLGVLVHVMLHWSWVCGVLARRILGQSALPDDGIRTVYGVGLLIGLLLIGAVTVGMAQWMIVLP